MLEMHKKIMEDGGFAIEIKPQIKTEEGEWIKNRDYKLKLLGARMKKVVPTNGGEPFELASYNCDIISENGKTQKGIYEISKTNRAGELNYQIKRMIELELSVGDIFTLKTDDNGYIDIQIVKKAEEKEKATPVVEDEEEILNHDDIPF